MVACTSIISDFSIHEKCRPLTQVEVVLHAVAQDQQSADGVHDGCSKSVSGPGPYCNRESLTNARRVLAKVAGLVAADQAGRLDLRSRAPRQAGVEVHDTLHASGILSGTDGLKTHIISYMVPEHSMSSSDPVATVARKELGMGWASPEGAGDGWRAAQKVTYIGGSDLESELASLTMIPSGGGRQEGVLPWGGSRSRDLGERRSSSCLQRNGISK